MRAPARGSVRRGIHPTSSSQVGREGLENAGLAGVLGTTDNNRLTWIIHESHAGERGL
jgi:hypothetical protein